MMFTFHWSLWSCQVPKAKVKMGMNPRIRIVGLYQESRRALYPALGPASSVCMYRRDMHFRVCFSGKDRDLSAENRRAENIEV